MAELRLLLIVSASRKLRFAITASPSAVIGDWRDIFLLPPDLWERGFVSDVWFRIVVFSLGALSILLTVVALFMH